MIFSSIEFLLFFLPLFLVLYGLTPKKYKNVTLLSGSLIFYAAGEPEFLVPLMVSVGVNYFFGLHLGRRSRRKKNRKNVKLEKKRKWLFPLAVAFNITILIMFKYVAPDALPLGISFYTFQILSYLIDLRRDEQTRETSFIKFATYVVMFPQLVSGPIVTYGEVREELENRAFTAKGVQEGLKVFTAGLMSKVLLADTFGILWKDVQVIGFESISTPMAWLGAIGFSLNIYFDFWGYSLMAVGTGRMLGFELPHNFKNPYIATTVRDFYRRWHMTLGRWFCRYVYIPLGGNRKGGLRTILNLLAVWLLTAIWHGNTANFLIWGLLLWFLIVLERQAEAVGLIRLVEKVPGKLFSHLYLWAVIPITWMCFAITDLGQLQVYLGRMFGSLPGVSVNVRDWQKVLTEYGVFLLVGALGCTPAAGKLFRKFKDSFFGILLLAALFWLCVWRLQTAGQNPFMYLKF